MTFFPNRSACYAALNKWEQAAEGGKQCIIVDKSLVKGYLRQALALQNMGEIESTLQATKRRLGIDSANVDLKKKNGKRMRGDNPDEKGGCWNRPSRVSTQGGRDQ